MKGDDMGMDGWLDGWMGWGNGMGKKWDCKGCDVAYYLFLNCSLFMMRNTK